MSRKIKNFGTLLAIALLFGHYSFANSLVTKNSVEKSLTERNIKGQINLYEKGWKIIPSGQEASDYFVNQSIPSAAQALSSAAESALKSGIHIKDLEDYIKIYEDIDNNFKGSAKETTAWFNQKIKALSNFRNTVPDNLMNDSKDSFILGYMTYETRTLQERKRLSQFFSKYVDEHKSWRSVYDKPTKNDDSITKLKYFSEAKEDNKEEGKEKSKQKPGKQKIVFKDPVLKKIDAEWTVQSKLANTIFVDKYKESGENDNSLYALADILSGYIQWVWTAVAKPTGKEIHNAANHLFYVNEVAAVNTARAATYVGGQIKEGAVYSGKKIASGIKYTGEKTYQGITYVSDVSAKGVLLAGSTINTTGRHLFAAGSMGYKLVSPSIESGVLASIALLTYASATTTEYALSGFGLISNYTIQGTGKAVATGTSAALAVTDTAHASVISVYELSKGASLAGFQTIKGGIVLGKAALMQIPSQILLGSLNSAIFLVYDGPKIVVKKITGENIQNLPTGTVVDIEKLEAAGYQSEEIKLNEKTKRKILEEIK
jgi:hypothetical protein